MSDAFFRAGVGAVVLDRRGRILVLKRKGLPEAAWQLPQGGIGRRENPVEALYRELNEETGLRSESVEVVKSSIDWLAYELPEGMRNDKVGWGQVQRWYLCRLRGAAEQVRPDQIEFEALDWVTPAQLLDRAVFFRKKLYARVVQEFGLAQDESAET